MSDAAVIDAPPVTPAAAPAAPAAAPEAPTGIAAMMAQLDADTVPKPAATPAPDAKATPDPKAPAADPKAKVEPAPNPKANTALSWDKAPEKFRKAYEESAKELEARDKKIAEFEAKIKAIEGKKVETPADTKLIEEYQGRIKALEQDLAQSSYERSPEFKRNYVEKWNNTYKSAVEEVKSLMVGEGVGDERKERPATEADFRAILKMETKDQGPAARRLFGDSADVILTHRNDLRRIEREGQEALAHAKETHETQSKEQQLASQKQQETYERSKQDAENELRTKWPQFFGDDPADEEVTQALNGGREFVKNAIAKMPTATPEVRAAYAAVIEARAAAYPRIALERNRANEKVKALETELAKYRGSDPGAAKVSGAAAKTGEGGEEPAEGIAALAAKFNT